LLFWWLQFVAGTSGRVDEAVCDELACVVEYEHQPIVDVVEIAAFAEVLAALDLLQRAVALQGIQVVRDRDRGARRIPYQVPFLMPVAHAKPTMRRMEGQVARANLGLRVDPGIAVGLVDLVVLLRFGPVTSGQERYDGERQ
jgi:hypothetical protein